MALAIWQLRCQRLGPDQHTEALLGVVALVILSFLRANGIADGDVPSIRACHTSELVFFN